MNAAIVMVLLSLTSWAQAEDSQEGKGGNITIPGFKRLGHYVSHHIRAFQPELAELMTEPEKLDENISKTPVRVVDEFPAPVVEKYGDNLVGVTIPDEESPTGFRILLHSQRYPEAFAEFAAGKEQESIRIVSSTRRITRGDYGRTTTVDETETRSVNHLNEGFEVFEGSFLVFVLHEFLLASGEDDENFEISPFLSANRAGFLAWVKGQRKVSPNMIKIVGPATIGEFFNGDNYQRRAIDQFLELWSSQGQTAETEFEAKWLDVLAAKGIVPRTHEWVGDGEEAHNCDAIDAYLQVATFYCKRQKSLEIKLSHYERKIKAIPLNDFSIYGGVTFQIIKDGRVDRPAVHQAYVGARQKYLDVYDIEMNRATEFAQSIYGDKLLLVGPGSIRIGHASITKPAHTVYFTYNNGSLHNGGVAAERTYPNARAYASMVPVAYVLD